MQDFHYDADPALEDPYMKTNKMSRDAFENMLINPQAPASHVWIWSFLHTRRLRVLPCSHFASMVSQYFPENCAMNYLILA